MQNSPYILPLLIATVTSAVLAVYAWQRRAGAGARAFTQTMAGMAAWASLNALQWASPSQEGQLFWAQLRFLATEWVVASFLVFALQYSGRIKELTVRRLLPLLPVPAIILLLAWTNESHHLFWADVRFVMAGDGTYNALDFTYGPAFWAHTAYDYLLLGLSTLVLNQVFLRSPRLYRVQTVSLLIGTLTPWLANIITIFGFSPIPYFDLTPLGFTLGGMVMAFGFFRSRMFEVLPAARGAVIENMVHGVVVLDADNHIVDLNPAASAIIGRPASQVVGKIAADVLSNWSDLVERFRHTMQGEAEIELQVNGAKRHFDMRISPLRDSRGRLTGRVVLLYDITERKTAEAALRHSERRTLEILEQIVDPYFEADLAGNLTYFNGPFLRGVGYEREEIIGRNYRHLTSRDDVRRVFEVFNQVYRSGQAATGFEYNILRKDGSLGYGEASVSLIRNQQGEPAGFRGIIRDITDRKRAEEAIQRAKEAAEHELEIGRRIQRGFLPQSIPQPDGWQIASYFESAREVAGDFYDVFYLSGEKRVGIVVADVCDKGLGAALFMALFRSLIRAFADQHYSTGLLGVITGEETVTRGSGRRRGLPSIGTTALKNAVSLTNNYIAHHHGQTNMFATLFFGVLDPGTGTLVYINGGHEPPLLIGADGQLKGRLPPTGPAVGMLPDLEFQIEECVLAEGDSLILVTDGVTEARGPDGGFYGEDRLLAVLCEPQNSAADLLHEIENCLRTYTAGTPQSDDISLVALRRSLTPPYPHEA
jgi:sigma-B regulation protein RsbU (phosphoserine phosphatase)